MFRPCQRIRTSMSPEQASSGATRWTSTVCLFLSGETTLGAVYRALLYQIPKASIIALRGRIGAR